MGDHQEGITPQLPAPPTSRSDPPPAPVGFVPPDWRRAYLGLTLIHLGLVLGLLGLLSLVAAVVSVLLDGSARTRTVDSSVLSVLFLGSGVLLLLSGLLTVTGEGVLCSTPAENHVRGWAIGTFVLGLLGRLLTGVTAVALAVALRNAPDPEALAPIAGQADPDPQALTRLVAQLAAAATALASVGETVLLALALRALALTLGQRKLGRRAAEYAQFFVTFVIVLTVLNLLVDPRLHLLPEDLKATSLVMVPKVLFIGELVCLLLLLGQLIGLVSETRAAVAAERSAKPPCPHAADLLQAPNFLRRPR